MDTIQAAQLVLSCGSLDDNVNFFKDRLGFRVDMISPADDPSTILMSGYGLTLRLERQTDHISPLSCTLRLILKEESTLSIDENAELIAPNGTKILLVKANSLLLIPPSNPSFVVSRINTDAQWIKGRAGMYYRDLIPGRQGGRFIASHIRIVEGGPVNDHVHYHNIRFQMIYVYKGWVRLVYEDQGQPFVLHGGDCVLQPPCIRHRVLESCPGLEVVEIACPAVHDTFIDHTVQLPNNDEGSERLYGGQRFIKYLAAEDKAPWKPWRLSDFEFKDLGITGATSGLAGANVIRTNGTIPTGVYQHSAEFVFIFILVGELSLRVGEKTIDKLIAGDSFVLPDHLPYTFLSCSKDVQFLEVSLPGTVPTVFHQD